MPTGLRPWVNSQEWISWAEEYKCILWTWSFYKDWFPKQVPFRPSYHLLPCVFFFFFKIILCIAVLFLLIVLAAGEVEVTIGSELLQEFRGPSFSEPDLLILILMHSLACSWQDCSFVTSCLGHGVLCSFLSVFLRRHFPEVFQRTGLHVWLCVYTGREPRRDKGFVVGCKLAKGSEESPGCLEQSASGWANITEARGWRGLHRGRVQGLAGAKDFGVEPGVEAAVSPLPLFCFLITDKSS